MGRICFTCSEHQTVANPSQSNEVVQMPQEGIFTPSSDLFAVGVTAQLGIGCRKCWSDGEGRDVLRQNFRKRFGVFFGHERLPSYMWIISKKNMTLRIPSLTHQDDQWNVTRFFWWLMCCSLSAKFWWLTWTLFCTYKRCVQTLLLQAALA